jgi:3-phosphoshikimate 1-carboxyvinyltransferase
MPLPDLIEIVPLQKPVQAEITVPGSKSITNRALILAALAGGETTLTGALWSEDTQVMVECLQELGFMVNVAPDPDEFCNRTITVYGQGGNVPRGGSEAQPLELFVGNAGTAARFLAAMVCLGEGVYRLHGVPRMHERPQAALFAALRQLGYRVESENGNDKLPARIFGNSESRIPNPESRHCRVSIEESSQFASALLLGATGGKWSVEIVGENAEESPYVAMTSELIREFRSEGRKFQIEPDASSGSYFWAADWILWVGGANDSLGKISIARWPKTRWQIDSEYPKYRNLLELNGFLSRKLHLGDSIMTAIVKAPLNRAPVTQQMSFADSPPMPAFAKPIEFRDLGRLRVQETERVFALKTELQRCGAKIEEVGDTLVVHSSFALAGPPDGIETYDDHRMAMCFAVLGLKVPGIRLRNPACVKKTFPNFFQKLAAAPPRGLGLEIRDGHTGRVLGHDELFAD